MGLRQLLNFGHTIGHALEQASHYKMSHGRGVATGMMLTQIMAEKEGLTSLNLSERFNKLLNDYHLLNQLSLINDYSFDELMAAMTNDKKRRGGEITEIFPEAFGRCALKTITFDQYASWLEKIIGDYKAGQLMIDVAEGEA